MLSRIRTLARPLLAPVLVVAALTSAAPLPTTASAAVVVAPVLPGVQVEYRYYSEPARINMVGLAYLYCDNSYELIWGVETSYVKATPYFCPDA